MGYHRAGFDVVGVDLHPQPNFPFEFHQMDALEFDVNGFDAIHASPPCQAFSFATLYHPGAKNNHPDLVDPTRQRLEASGVPYIIENVMGAPLRKDVVLCGEMFDLRVHRHRLFELGGGFKMEPVPHQKHKLKGARNNCDRREGHTRLVAGNYSDHPDASDAMGIDWMNRNELRQAIPPAYTQFIGEALITHIKNGG